MQESLEEEEGVGFLFRSLYEKERKDEEKWAVEKMRKSEEEGKGGGGGGLDSLLSFLIPKSLRSSGDPDEQEVEESEGKAKKGKGKGKGKEKEGNKEVGNSSDEGNSEWDDVCLAYQNLREVFNAEKEAEALWVTKKAKLEENEREKNRLFSFFSFLLPSSSSSTPQVLSPIDPSLDSLPSSIEYGQTYASNTHIPIWSPQSGSRKRKTPLEFGDDLLGEQVGPKRRRTDPNLLSSSSSPCGSMGSGGSPVRGTPSPGTPSSPSPPSGRTISSYF